MDWTAVPLCDPALLAEGIVNALLSQAYYVGLEVGNAPGVLAALPYLSPEAVGQGCMGDPLTPPVVRPPAVGGGGGGPGPKTLEDVIAERYGQGQPFYIVAAIAVGAAAVVVVGCLCAYKCWCTARRKVRDEDSEHPLKKKSEADGEGERPSWRKGGTLTSIFSMGGGTTTASATKSGLSPKKR